MTHYGHKKMRPHTKRKLNSKPVSLIAGILFSSAFSAAACNLNLSNAVGPWDYGAPENHAPNGSNPMGNVKRVTNVHLTPSMLNLQRGGTAAIIGSDLDYTLRAIPNHPQALLLASKLERLIELKLAHRYERMKTSAECYFQRAIKLNPQLDSTRIVYGIHLHQKKHYSKAIEQYTTALNNGSSSTNLHYNIALTLVELKKYEDAKKHAEIAYGRGFPLPGLKNKLKKSGYPIDADNSVNPTP